MVPLSAFAKWTSVPVRPLSISHQGQFPAITISFNLAPGVALGQARGRTEQRCSNSARRRRSLELSGHRAGVSAFARHGALLILAAMVAVYIILGILYESYILPLTILSTLPSAGLGALAN